MTPAEQDDAETLRLLPAKLRERSVEPAAGFAASAAQFDGWGALDVLQKVASPDVLAALGSSRELPD